MNAIFLAWVRKGKLFLDNEQQFRDYLFSLNDKRTEVIVRLPRKDRSNSQNRYMWGVVYELLSETTGFTPEEIHDAMRMLFLLDRDRKIPTLKSTTSLTTVEIELYLTKIREFASRELNCYIPLPNEVESD